MSAWVHPFMAAPLAGPAGFQSNPPALLGSTMNEIGVRMGASLYGHIAYAAGWLSK